MKQKHQAPYKKESYSFGILNLSCALIMTTMIPHAMDKPRSEPEKKTSAKEMFNFIGSREKRNREVFREKLAQKKIKLDAPQGILSNKEKNLNEIKEFWENSNALYQNSRLFLEKKSFVPSPSYEELLTRQTLSSMVRHFLLSTLSKKANRTETLIKKANEINQYYAPNSEQNVNLIDKEITITNKVDPSITQYIQTLDGVEKKIYNELLYPAYKIHKEQRKQSIYAIREENKKNRLVRLPKNLLIYLAKFGSIEKEMSRVCFRFHEIFRKKAVVFNNRNELKEYIDLFNIRSLFFKETIIESKAHFSSFLKDHEKISENIDDYERTIQAYRNEGVIKENTLDEVEDLLQALYQEWSAPFKNKDPKKETPVKMLDSLLEDLYEEWIDPSKNKDTKEEAPVKTLDSLLQDLSKERKNEAIQNLLKAFNPVEFYKNKLFSKMNEHALESVMDDWKSTDFSSFCTFMVDKIGIPKNFIYSLRFLDVLNIILIKSNGDLSLEAALQELTDYWREWCEDNYENRLFDITNPIQCYKEKLKIQKKHLKQAPNTIDEIYFNFDDYVYISDENFLEKNYISNPSFSALSFGLFTKLKTIYLGTHSAQMYIENYLLPNQTPIQESVSNVIEKRLKELKTNRIINIKKKAYHSLYLTSNFMEQHPHLLTHLNSLKVERLSLKIDKSKVGDAKKIYSDFFKYLKELQTITHLRLKIPSNLSFFLESLNTPNKKFKFISFESMCENHFQYLKNIDSEHLEIKNFPSKSPKSPHYGDALLYANNIRHTEASLFKWNVKQIFDIFPSLFAYGAFLNSSTAFPSLKEYIESNPQSFLFSHYKESQINALKKMKPFIPNIYRDIVFTISHEKLSEMEQEEQNISALYLDAFHSTLAYYGKESPLFRSFIKMHNLSTNVIFKNYEQVILHLNAINENWIMYQEDFLKEGDVIDSYYMDDYFLGALIFKEYKNVFLKITVRHTDNGSDF